MDSIFSVHRRSLISSCIVAALASALAAVTPATAQKFRIDQFSYPEGKDVYQPRYTVPLDAPLDIEYRTLRRALTQALNKTCVDAKLKQQLLSSGQSTEARLLQASTSKSFEQRIELRDWSQVIGGLTNRLLNKPACPTEPEPCDAAKTDGQRGSETGTAGKGLQVEKGDVLNRLADARDRRTDLLEKRQAAQQQLAKALNKLTLIEMFERGEINKADLANSYPHFEEPFDAAGERADAKNEALQAKNTIERIGKTAGESFEPQEDEEIKKYRKRHPEWHPPQPTPNGELQRAADDVIRWQERLKELGGNEAPPEMRVGMTCPFEGMYGGFELVKNTGSQKIKEFLADTGRQTNSLDDRNDPVGIGIVAGYNYALPNGVRVGPFASLDYIDQNINRNFAAGTFIGTTSNWKATLGVKAGLIAHQNILLYGLAGFGLLNQNLNINFGGPRTSENATVSGATLGLGAEWMLPSWKQLSNPVALFIHYQHAWWANATLSRPAASPLFNYAFRREDDTIKLGVNFYFQPQTSGRLSRR